MASSKPDACIFCDESPCVCNKKPAKKAAARSRPPKPVSEEPVRKGSHLDAMRAAAAAAPPKPVPQPESVRRPIETKMSEADIMFNAAVRNLGPLLCEEDREKWGGIINSSPHPDEAKIMWKARRKEDG